MTEQDFLVKMAKRLQASGAIDDLSLPTTEHRELSWHSNGWHGYWVRFQFNDDGVVIETSSGC